MRLATLCYIMQDEKILMLRRNKKKKDIHEGKYVAIGGKFEPGESPEECVVREVKEECGLKILNPELKGILTFSNKNRKFGEKKAEQDWYVFVYTANSFEGKLTNSQEGDLKWIARTEISELPMWEGDKIFTQWIFRKGIFSGKFEYRDNKLVSHTVRFYE